MNRLYHTLFTVIILNTCSDAVTFLKSATLTANSSANSGAKANIIDDVTTNDNNNEWMVNMTDTVGWSMKINLTNSWGFHPSITSKIKIKFHGSSVSTNNLNFLIAFAPPNSNQWTAINIRLDNDNNNNQNVVAVHKYLAANWIIDGDPVLSATFGPNTSLYCSLFDRYHGGDCNALYQRPLLPESCCYDNEWPLTFTLINNLLSDHLDILYQGGDWNTEQSFKFDGTFMPNDGLDIYIAANTKYESFIISKIDIEYSYQYFTGPPSPFPTMEPTMDTIPPTTSPIMRYTQTTILKTENQTDQPPQTDFDQVKPDEAKSDEAKSDSFLNMFTKTEGIIMLIVFGIGICLVNITAIVCCYLRLCKHKKTSTTLQKHVSANRSVELEPVNSNSSIIVNDLSGKEVKWMDKNGPQNGQKSMTNSEELFDEYDIGSDREEGIITAVTNEGEGNPLKTDIGDV